MNGIKKNFIFNIALTLLNSIFPVVVFSYTARIMGPVYIGRAQFILSIAQYFCLFASLGIPFYGIREVARIKDNPQLLSKFTSEMLTISIATSILMSLAFYVFILNVTFISKDINAYWIASLMVSLNFFAVDWFFSGIQDFKFITIRSLMVKLTCVVLVVLTVKEPNDFLWYVSVLVLATVGNNLLNIQALKKKGHIKFQGLDIKRHFKPVLLIFGTSLAISLYQVFDTILLRLLSNDETVGYYVAAVKINKLVLPFIISLGTVLIPAISGIIGKNDKTALNKLISISFSFISLVSIPIGVLFFLYAGEIIALFSGDQFTSAIIAAKIMSPLCFIIGLSNLYGLQILTSAKKDKEVLFSVIGGVIISICLNVILVPIYKQNGAAWANIGCELFVTAVAFYYARKFFSIGFNYKYLGTLILPCLFFVPIYILVTSLFPHKDIVVLLAGVFISILLYFIVQLFLLKNEIALMIMNTVKNSVIKA